MRRIALTITAVALTLAPFSAAGAQQPQGPVITVVKPAAGEHVGTVDVEAEIHNDNALTDIKTWRVELLKADGSVVGQFCTETYDQADPQPGGPEPIDDVSIKFKWNTERLPAPGGDGNCQDATSVLPAGGSLSKNEKFKIRFYSENFPLAQQAAQTDTEVTGELTISNAPKAPTGVKLSYDKGAKLITLEWSKNTEPDVSKYRIHECIVDKSSKPCGSGDWKLLADNHATTSASVQIAGPGIYRYRAAALRLNGAGNQTMVSEWASAKNEPIEIEVKDDPPETTTSQPEPDAPPGPPATVTRTVVQPTRRVQRAAPQVLQRIVEEEPGYNTELPYQGDKEAIGGLPVDSGGGEGQRAILIPLAGGALLLVFAMQVHYLNRRANSALETVPAGDLDGEDWDWDD